MNPGQNSGQTQMTSAMEMGVNVKTIPTGVKIISILYYIGAVFAAISGILFIIGASFISSLLNSIPLLSALGSSLFIVVGIVFILLGILQFFIARGLWKGRNWARVLVIIFSVIAILLGIYVIIQGSIMNGIINLVFSGIIGGYLLFSRKVKDAFS